MSLFGRKASLQVSTLKVEGLDIRFDVQLDDKNLGKAEITVYNLNSGHRKSIEQQAATSTTGVEVSLSAGYQGQDLGLLFKGDIREAFSVKDPPDWVTTLSTGDGDGACQARCNKSFNKGTDFSAIVKDAAEQLKSQVGIGLGNLMSAIKKGSAAEGLSQLLSGGDALQGSLKKEIDRRLHMLGLEGNIQDKEWVVTEIGKPLDASAVRLTPGTGLIGSPQRNRKKGEAILKVRSLLIPGLRPKRLVQVESALVSGLYVVRRAQYKGDTAGNDWYADLECIEQ